LDECGGVRSLRNISPFYLFGLITLFGKTVPIEEGPKRDQKARQISLIGTGLVGSIGLYLSDSFWFSAVEAEKFTAMSSLLPPL